MAGGGMSGERTKKAIAIADQVAAWRRKLLVNAEKKPRSVIANVLVALSEAPEWRGVLGYDVFANATRALKPPPRADQQKVDLDRYPRLWTDADDVHTAAWLDHQQINVSIGVVAQAVVTVARGNSFHPVRDYLADLVWDRVTRIDRFLVTHFGADDSDYCRAVSRCMLIASVARVREPGCKHDHLPILEGAQGTLKSTALAALYAPWFSDDIADLGTKDAAMQLAAGSWCIELSELSAMSRSEVERVKAFVSRRLDKLRLPYSRHVTEIPRQCVLIGTTNDPEYLKDESGNRRFWPIACGTIDPGAITRDRDQLWAEAVAAYEAGEKWWLSNPMIIAAAVAEQDARFMPDAWRDLITAYVDNKTETSVADILEHCLGIEASRWSRGSEMRVGKIVSRLPGWRRQRVANPGDKRMWIYRRQM